jgi:hypothetical protein
MKPLADSGQVKIIKMLQRGAFASEKFRKP